MTVFLSLSQIREITFLSLSTGCLALARHREPEELEGQAVPARLEGEQLLLHEHRLATVSGFVVAGL